MTYLSLFSGIGGLESSTEKPLLYCEIDTACHRVLQARSEQAISIVPDITKLHPPAVDVVAGGWPCQDVSVAGKRRGLGGERSGLVVELVRVAVESGAHSIVAENVPNLLVMNDGAEFADALRLFQAAGYSHVSWRTLNARQFGLPQQRERIVMVASRYEAVAWSLHREIPESPHGPGGPFAAGFYWTAGLQGLSYRIGVAPTLKVGSSLSIASPPAVETDETVRKLTPSECLRLQGFDPAAFQDVKAADVYRMAGNAVAAPVGSFAVDSVLDPQKPDGALAAFDVIKKNGVLIGGVPYAVEHAHPKLASNLGEFLEPVAPELSARAALGLLARLDRSGRPCPDSLREKLESIAASSEVTADLQESEIA